MVGSGGAGIDPLTRFANAGVDGQLLLPAGQRQVRAADQQNSGNPITGRKNTASNQALPAVGSRLRGITMTAATLMIRSTDEQRGRPPGPMHEGSI